MIEGQDESWEFAMDSVTILIHVLLNFWPDPASILPLAMLFACLLGNRGSTPWLGRRARPSPAQDDRHWEPKPSLQWAS
ncbi:hypothetical protein FANTH_11905 [Fusarium anthophilum]|uniref:Uncharacterized protein n=1 Tax=Fusarium anthophilum TaxID=48485 RepID=A0A8H4YW88_9HYPO|nr:hypothetical protein FANTH_11905 [Fusarium anthophilum]